MNRADLIHALAYLGEVEAQVATLAGRIRATLDADARAEYAEQKTAPTWRAPDVARLSGSISQRAVVVSDPVTFADWVTDRYPTEVETRVRSEWQKAFLKRAVVESDGTVVDGRSGEIVPGVTVRVGGEFRGISLTVEPDARALLADLAQQTVRQALAGSDVLGLHALEAGTVDS